MTMWHGWKVPPPPLMTGADFRRFALESAEEAVLLQEGTREVETIHYLCEQVKRFASVLCEADARLTREEARLTEAHDASLRCTSTACAAWAAMGGNFPPWKPTSYATDPVHHRSWCGVFHIPGESCKHPPCTTCKHEAAEHTPMGCKDGCACTWEPPV